MNVADIAPGLTRVQLTVEADPSDDTAGLAIAIDEGSGVRVKWDDGAIDWIGPQYLCREGDRPEREPSERDLERHNDPERIADLRYHHFGEGR